jgi:phospholipid/cholesterol/gamma-HCH transport system substrate-binding protein
VKTAIRKHLGDFLAILALFVMACGVAGFLLTKQRLRFPLVQEKTYRVKAVLPNSQAVTPGQGQTVRIAGVEVGQIGKVNLEDGRAVVNLEIEPKYKTLIKRDASALLRAKTGVKDMFIEVDPGDSDQTMPRGERIPVQNTEQDIDPDEILSVLDSDTRDYLRLLVSGAGKGLKGRGSDLQEALARLGPLHKDLAKVTKGVARRRANLRRLIHNYGLLTAELGNNGKSLTRLVSSSSEVFDALASENQNISTAVARLPGTLRQTQSTLAKVDPYAQRLQSSLQALRPAFRQLDDTNRAVIPAVKEGTPILKNQVRPFARAARPFTSNLGQSAKNLSGAAPQLTATFHELNRLFNIGVHNPNGREGLTGDLAKDRQRDEGYLYWLAWTAQNTVSLFSTSDANGPYRRFFLGGLGCGTLAAVLPPGIDPLIVQNLQTAGLCAGGPGGGGSGLPLPGGGGTGGVPIPGGGGIGGSSNP